MHKETGLNLCIFQAQKCPRGQLIVNENYEVIDGQARLTYCKETGQPIAYFVLPGLKIEHCIAMNASTKNWGLRDYSKSYAKQGYQSYVRLENLLDKYGYPVRQTLFALTNGNELGFHTNIKEMSDEFKQGKFDVSQELCDTAENLLTYWKRFDDIEKNRTREFYMALGYCYMFDDVDNEILYKKVHKKPREFTDIGNTLDAIRRLDSIYNYRRSEKVYIELEYKQLVDRMAHEKNVRKNH